MALNGGSAASGRPLSASSTGGIYPLADANRRSVRNWRIVGSTLLLFFLGVGVVSAEAVWSSRLAGGSSVAHFLIAAGALLAPPIFVVVTFWIATRNLTSAQIRIDPSGVSLEARGRLIRRYPWRSSPEPLVIVDRRIPQTDAQDPGSVVASHSPPDRAQLVVGVHGATYVNLSDAALDAIISYAQERSLPLRREVRYAGRGLNAYYLILTLGN